MLSACETQIPCFHGPLFWRHGFAGSGTFAIEGAVPADLTRQGYRGIEVDTYRLGHPRRRRPGDKVDWKVLGMLTAPGLIWIVGLIGAPFEAGSRGLGSETCTTERGDFWAQVHADRPAREALERRRWLAARARDPGITTTLAAPQEGEGWLSIGDLVAPLVGDDGIGPAEVLSEIASNEHGMRAWCAETLGRVLSELPEGPIRLDARGLEGPQALGWLRIALRPLLGSGRAVLVSAPRGWSATFAGSAERVLNSRAD